ncbi:MAG: hypothetical protein ACE363_13065 [Alphaproteobacteria bacterium]
MTALSFETLGNATIQLFADNEPLLVTDPWLFGTAYFDSWALERPANGQQIQNAIESEFVWISHGHPDHLHPDSLSLFPPDKKFLIADHYSTELEDTLTAMGFDVTVMQYRQWIDLGRGVEVLSFDNPDQDAVLVIRTPDALIVNLNDADLWGESAFLRRLITSCPTDKTFVLALCDYMGDMRNIVDSEGRRTDRDPGRHREGCIRRIGRISAKLGARHYMCSSFQHRYVHTDSAWANEGRITFEDMQQYWSRPEITLVPPFAHVNLTDASISPGDTGTASPEAVSALSEDDWEKALTSDQWDEVVTFFRTFQTLEGIVDDVTVVVAGEARTIRMTRAPLRRRLGRERIIRFYVPSKPLMMAVGSGYFDDLLLANVMKTELVRARLYPHFTPRLSKLGGNAGVRTNAEMRTFWRHYRRRNRTAMLRWNLAVLREKVISVARRVATLVGLEHSARALYWKLRGDTP